MSSESVPMEDAVRSHLERFGGVVLQRIIDTLKSSYPDAPELESEEAFKQFLEGKDDFRITTSVNNVERVRLTNAHRNATEEGAAVSTDTLFDKVVALKTESLEDGQDLPEDLKSKDTFMLSIKRLLRLEITDGSVYLKPRRPRNESRPETEGRRARPRRRRKPKASTSPDPNRGEDAPEGERRKASPRRRRPQGTPQEPRDVALPADVNDSTTIAHLCYKKLCERGAINITLGLTTKLLLRLVSADFKEMRPEDELPSSMTSLRVFKMLLAAIPGIKRQRPRVQDRSGQRRARGPLEIIVWIDEEDEIVAGLEKGLDEDLANAVVVPDVLENAEELQKGTPQAFNVLEQESWNTSVVGPTSDESVLETFLSDRKEQAIWAVETEHRVAIGRKPAGKIAIVVLSDMHDTIIWDALQGGFPTCLHEFFANEKLFKGGVRIAPKATKLKKQYDAQPAQLVELSTIAQTLGLLSEEEMERVSMRVMTQNVLDCPRPAQDAMQVSRPPGVRDSNWELRPLTKRQYNYAVEDGFVTALLFMQMVASLHANNQGGALNDACIKID